MKRNDLPEPVWREVAWYRRRTIRAVGSAIDALVDAGVDPTEMMGEVSHVLLQHLNAAQNADERDAA